MYSLEEDFEKLDIGEDYDNIVKTDIYIKVKPEDLAEFKHKIKSFLIDPGKFEFIEELAFGSSAKPSYISVSARLLSIDTLIHDIEIFDINDFFVYEEDNKEKLHQEYIKELKEYWNIFDDLKLTEDNGGIGKYQNSMSFSEFLRHYMIPNSKCIVRIGTIRDEMYLEETVYSKKGTISKNSVGYESCTRHYGL